MDDLGDSLVKIATDLIKAGAILPVVGFGCLYLMASLAEIAHELVRDPPLYWLCFGLRSFSGASGRSHSCVSSCSTGATVPPRSVPDLFRHHTEQGLPARPQRRQGGAPRRLLGHGGQGVALVLSFLRAGF
jgi:hypothetical protein